jgi:hypothetical protein
MCEANPGPGKVSHEQSIMIVEEEVKQGEVLATTCGSAFSLDEAELQPSEPRPAVTGPSSCIASTASPNPL